MIYYLLLAADAALSTAERITNRNGCPLLLVRTAPGYGGSSSSATGVKYRCHLY